jgi:hypothetical protein
MLGRTRSLATTPQTGVDAVMRIFARAVFAQYHFVEIHPFFDGNARRVACLGMLLPAGAAHYDGDSATIHCVLQ